MHDSIWAVALLMSVLWGYDVRNRVSVMKQHIQVLNHGLRQALDREKILKLKLRALESESDI